MTDNTESFSDEFRRHRRALVLLSTGLLLLSVGGGKLKKFSFLGGEVDFSDPGALVFLLYITLLYLTIRFRIEALPFHTKLLKQTYLTMKNSTNFSREFETHLATFREEQGIDQTEMFGDLVTQVRPEEQFSPLVISDRVERAENGARILTFSVCIGGEDRTQNFNLSSYRRYWISAFFKTLLDRSEFFEIWMPYLLVGLALLCGVLSVVY